MRSFRHTPVFALLCVSLFSLTGCGGSDNPTPSSSPSPATSAPLRSEFVGEWEGPWSVKNGTASKPSSTGGNATLSVQSNGRYVLNLENYQNSRETLAKVTMTGIMSQNGNFSARVPGLKDNDTLAGSFVLPLVPSDKIKMLLTRTHLLISGGAISNAGGITGETDGSMQLTRKK